MREMLCMWFTWTLLKPWTLFPTVFSWRNWLLMAWTDMLFPGKTGWMAKPRGWWWMGDGCSYSSWWLVASGDPGLRWGQSYLISLSIICMRGSRAPSVTSQVTPICVGVWICWKVRRLCDAHQKSGRVVWVKCSNKPPRNIQNGKFR